MTLYSEKSITNDVYYDEITCKWLYCNVYGDAIVARDVGTTRNLLMILIFTLILCTFRFHVRSKLRISVSLRRSHRYPSLLSFMLLEDLIPFGTEKYSKLFLTKKRLLFIYPQYQISLPPTQPEPTNFLIP